MTSNTIQIKGAKVNNLKNIDLEIPLNKLICFFGPSGSGKTSLAFQTLYSESKRRFLNSFPSYVKFFSDRPAPVDVDSIFPVLPVFGLPQNNPVAGTRSNAADIMHLTELFQNLFYHSCEQLCPKHLVPYEEQGIVDAITKEVEFLEENEVIHILISAESFSEHFHDRPFPSRSIKSTRSRKILDFDNTHALWEVLRFKKKGIDKISEKLQDYLNQNIELSLFSEGLKRIVKVKFTQGIKKCERIDCDEVAENNITPLSFSPYNPIGACNECNGFGEILNYDEEKLMDINKSVKDGGATFLNYKRFSGQKEELIKVMKKEKVSTLKPIKDLPQEFMQLLYDGKGSYKGYASYLNYLERKKYKMHVRIFIRNIQKSETCPECYGSRISKSYHNFFLKKSKDYSVPSMSRGKVNDVLEKIETLCKEEKFEKKEIKSSLVKIKEVLKVASEIGLGHLNLERKAKSLSAGEYQRLLLLKFLSYEGKDCLFIFDEPSLGLSILEKKALLKSFQKLIEQKNTVIVIDHSKFFQKQSDFLVEMGPESGSSGGKLIYAGEKKNYKLNAIKHDLKPIVKNSQSQIINVEKPEIYGKTYKSFDVPVNSITLVNGASGSGKTSCLINILANHLHYKKYESYLPMTKGSFKKMNFGHHFNEVVVVDSNLNRYTSRSTVGSLTDLVSIVRKHFVKTSQAKALGLKDGHFSPNSQLGQCPKCEGRGVQVIEMQFLEDIILECEDCKGKKLKPIYANINDGHFTVNEAYSKPISEVISKMTLTPKYQRIFEYIKILNLDYLSLNRTIKSLSGGEKQRIYLLSKLLKNLTDSILFFENLSFGLSEKELINICNFLQSLNAKKNTIVLIDQDDFFKNISTHEVRF